MNKTPHPDKEKIVALVGRLLHRSGLTIKQVVARMQAAGCDLTRASFENRFTSRIDRYFNIPPAWTLALVAALTERLTEQERCTATEAIELARLARLPIDQFETLQTYFPAAEFLAAYNRYAPTPDQSASPPTAPPAGNGRPTPDAPCPYRGLQVFDETHAGLFFGREADVARLLDSLRAHRFLAVIGPSGSGKSSLVRAGLIPALRQGKLQITPDDGTALVAEAESSDQWLIQQFEPGPHPLEALAEALLACCPRALPRALRQLLEELAVDERSLHLLTLEILARHPANSRLVLVIDQFEELFTLTDNETARQAFLDNLLYPLSLPTGRLTVILTMRADFYSQAALYPRLADYLADCQRLISPMTEPELTQAIIRPAQKVGLRFEAGLVDRLLHDTVAEPGALPLLQHSLLELWQRRQDGQLTLAAYQASGGVHGALAQRADSLLATLPPDQQAIMRRVMLRLTRLGEGTADTRRRAGLNELIYTPAEADDVRSVITRLADARLVTTTLNAETGAETVDVAHEALIRGWPTLQRWLTEDRESLRLHQQLTEAAAEWQRQQRDPSYLYRGARLSTLTEWAESHTAEMNEPERDFWQAGLDAHRQASRAAEQRRRRTMLALTVGLLIMMALALLAFSQWRQVALEQQMTLSRRLAAEARTLYADQPDTALLLSAEALHVADTLEARSALLESLQTFPWLTSLGRAHTGWVWAVAYSPQGDTLASAGADGTIILWDTATRQPLGEPLTGHTGWARAVAFSPDGATLASGGADGTVRLWVASTGQPLDAPLTDHTSFVTAVAFSPDGQTLASASADGTIRLWDVETGEPRGNPLTGHTSFVLTVAFSPDGQTLASGGEDQSVILWDISADPTATQPLARALTGHQGAVTTVTFDPTGRTLASGSTDGTIILWNIETRQPGSQPLEGHQGPVSSLAFTLDGQSLVSGSADQTIIVWDVATRQPRLAPLRGQRDRVLMVAVQPDSTGNTLTLATGSADGTVGWWHVTPHSPLARPLSGHTAGVEAVRFSPDGHTLATGGRDNRIILWDITGAESISRTLTGHTDAVRSLAFSPDGTILLSGSRDRRLIRWDVARGQADTAPPSTGTRPPSTASPSAQTEPCWRPAAKMNLSGCGTDAGRCGASR